ncbi:MAG: MerR family transcriptional regulator [Candidatus Omnitrophota bacterium]
MGNKIFTIKDVAKKLGISKQTVLRYEKREIFPKPRRNLVNHWREYTEADLRQLRKALGRT